MSIYGPVQFSSASAACCLCYNLITLIRISTCQPTTSCDLLKSQQLQLQQCQDSVSLLSGIRNDIADIKRSVVNTSSCDSPPSDPCSNNNSLLYSQGDCVIDLQAYGAYDPNFNGHGLLRINLTVVHQFNVNGIYAAAVDPLTCTYTALSPFNPSTAGVSVLLTSFIESFTRGHLLVATTGRNAFTGLSPAYSAFNSLGVNLTNLVSSGSFAFVAQKGYSQKTIAIVRGSVRGNIFLTVRASGTSHENVVLTKLYERCYNGTSFSNCE